MDGTGAAASVAIADWDGGGADVVVGSGDELVLLGNDGVGGLSAAGSVGNAGLVGPITAIAHGQVDEGTTEDLVVLSASDLADVLFGDGAGTTVATAHTTGGGDSPVDLCVADLIGTGATDDIAVAMATGCSVLTETSGTTGTGFALHYALPCDQDPHVVLARTSARHSSWIGAGGTDVHVHTVTVAPDGVATGQHTTIVLPAIVERLIAADFDADGDDDVIAMLDDARLAILTSDGADGWESVRGVSYSLLSLDAQGHDLVAGDLDGDADVDLAVIEPSLDTIELLLTTSLAPGATRVSVSLATGADPTRIAGGDLNGDGVADLAVLTRTPDELTVLLSDP